MQKNLKTIFGKDHGLDDKSVEFLTKALEKNNLPGFDYIEFKQSLAALSSMNLDEETAFKSAFATASTMGLTKSKLTDSAAHYKKVLIKEKSQFEVAMQNQLKQRVDGKVKEVEKLKAQIVKHQEKIQQLQQQIDQYQHTIDGADAQINEAKEKIEGTKQGFDTAHQSILNQIEKDINNINVYL